MCQHVIVDFCLTFHSGQELLISSLIIINISVILIFASSWLSSPSSSSSLLSRLTSSPPVFVQLWTAAKQQRWRCTLVRSEKDCLQKCRITIASDVLCGLLACFLNCEKSSGQLGSDLFFARINFLKTCIMTNGWCDQQESFSSGLSSQVLEIFLKSLWGIFLILVLKGTRCRIAFSSVE